MVNNSNKIIRIFVPILIVAAILTVVIWMLAGADVSFALTRMIAVLLVGCPCALALSKTVAIKIGKRIASENGLTYKNDKDLLEAGRTRIVAMNKIGTITKGEYVVTDVFSADHITKSGYNAGVFDGDDELLETAHVLGSFNDHPMSEAVIKHTSELYIQAEEEVENFKYYPGSGLEGEIGGVPIRGGNLKFVEEKAIISPEIRERAMSLSEQGKTPLYFSKGRRLLGIIAVGDSLIENTTQAISELRNMGIKVFMLTGDNEYTGRAIAEKVGIAEIVPEVNPERKEEILKTLSELGKVTLIGDDAKNDDIVIMKKSIPDVVASIRLSRMVLRIINENTIFALIFNIIGIIPAAGLFYKASGFLPGLGLCAAALLLSVIIVLLNALRLKMFDIRDSSRDKPVIIK